MPFLYRCDCCNSLVLWGGILHDGIRLCSLRCKHQMFGFPEFCKECQSDSTDTSIFGGASTLSEGTGSRLSGPIETCKVCSSELRTKWRIVLMVHLYPLGTYRMLRLEDGSYICRQTRTIPPRYFRKVMATQALAIAGAVATVVGVVWIETTYQVSKRVGALTSSNRAHPRGAKAVRSRPSPPNASPFPSRSTTGPSVPGTSTQ